MFEVDTRELARRVRRSTGNPYVLGIRFRRIEVQPQDATWWAGRERRFARLYLSEMDRRALEFVREISPTQHRRLLRLLAELLDVERLEFLPLAASSGAWGRLSRLWAGLLDRHQVAQLGEGRLVDQLQRP